MKRYLILIVTFFYTISLNAATPQESATRVIETLEVLTKLSQSELVSFKKFKPKFETALEYVKENEDGLTGEDDDDDEKFKPKEFRREIKAQLKILDIKYRDYVEKVTEHQEKLTILIEDLNELKSGAINLGDEFDTVYGKVVKLSDEYQFFITYNSRATKIIGYMTKYKKYTKKMKDEKSTKSYQKKAKKIHKKYLKILKLMKKQHRKMLMTLKLNKIKTENALNDLNAILTNVNLLH